MTAAGVTGAFTPSTFDITEKENTEYYSLVDLEVKNVAKFAVFSKGIFVDTKPVHIKLPYHIVVLSTIKAKRLTISTDLNIFILSELSLKKPPTINCMHFRNLGNYQWGLPELQKYKKTITSGSFSITFILSSLKVKENISQKKEILYLLRTLKEKHSCPDPHSLVYMLTTVVNFLNYPNGDSRDLDENGNFPGLPGPHAVADFFKLIGIPVRNMDAYVISKQNDANPDNGDRKSP